MLTAHHSSGAEGVVSAALPLLDGVDIATSHLTLILCSKKESRQATHTYRYIYIYSAHGVSSRNLWTANVRCRHFEAIVGVSKRWVRPGERTSLGHHLVLDGRKRGTLNVEAHCPGQAILHQVPELHIGLDLCGNSSIDSRDDFHMQVRVTRTGKS